MDSLKKVKDFALKNLFGIVSLSIAIVSITGSIYYVYINKCEPCEMCNSLIEVEHEAKEDLDESFKVDVKGAVKKPGVYEVRSSNTVQDAINLAGGLNTNAVTTNINLSKRLHNEMVVYVFTKSELKEKSTTNELVCEIPKCECETIVVNKEICTEEKKNTTVNEPNDSAIKDQDASSKAKEQTSNTDKISINTDSISELTKLEGIGESKAKTIIEYRHSHGDFKSIEEIMNVSGIGEKAYEKIKDKITV